MQRPATTTLTLWLGLGNLVAYGVTYALDVWDLGYHLSRDFPDGAVIFNAWMLVGSPLLSLATIAVAIREYRRWRGSRALTVGMLSTAAALAVSLVAMGGLFRPR